MRKLQLFSLLSFAVLVACQSMGPAPETECVTGFVKTQSGCRSVKSLSSEELSNADSNVAETKIMIERVKAAETANRRAQMDAAAAAARSEENTAAVATNQYRTQAPVGFLGERTSAPLPRVTEKAALRNELKASFQNELRGKSLRGGTINDGFQ